MSCNAIRKLDLLGYGNTWLHRIDARAKLAASMIFLICVSSFPKYEVAALIPFFLVPVLWSSSGNVPSEIILKILCVTAPFAILLGSFNPLLDHNPMLSLGGLTLSGGWISFSSILIRFVLSVNIVLLLVATTSMPGIFTALLKLKIPKAFVLQLDFLYRYLFVLVDEGTDLNNARKLRDPGRRLPSISLVARLISSLLYRSIERAQRIYLCMQARGFEGEIPVFCRKRLTVIDCSFVLLILLYCLAARLLPLTLWIGTSVQGVAGF